MGQGSSSAGGGGGGARSGSVSVVLKREGEGEAVEEARIEGEDWTQYAPDECVAAVFRKLGPGDRNRCALVCKRWLRVEGQSRQRLALQASADLGPELPGLLQRFQHITKLVLKCERRVTSIDDDALCIVGRHCRQLHKLKLKGCKGITDSGIDQFARLCGPLKKIYCGSCQFGPDGLNSILQHCLHLEDLTLKRLRGFIKTPPPLVYPGCCNIKRLCVKELPNGQVLGPLIASSKSLHTLMLSKVSGNWDMLLELITDHMTSLVEFHMEKLNVTDHGLRAVGRFSNLEVLYLVKPAGCTNHGLSAIANGCQLLRKLHVDVLKSSHVGDEGLAMVARRCKGLQELVIVGIHATTISLSLLASDCLALERLAICTSKSFGDLELSCIATKCLALKKLCIKSCPISDLGMESLVGGCPSLVKMKVKKCNAVTPASVALLSTTRVSLLVTVDTPPSPMVPQNTLGEANDFIPEIVRPSQIRRPLARARLAISLAAITVLRWSASKGS